MGINCTECEAGVTYQNATGQTVCKACDSCDPGYSVSATVCTPTTGGVRKTENQNMSAIPDYCQACSSGKFGDSINLVTCRSCMAGQFSLLANTSCSRCPVGFAQPLAEQAECHACPAGWQQPLIGESSCTACTKGQHQSKAGTDTCVSCPAGQFQQEVGSGDARCKDCPTGYTARFSGRPSCESCADPLFEYTPSPGATVCNQCSTNAQVAMTGDTCVCKTGINADGVGPNDPEYQPTFFEVDFDDGTFPNATALNEKCSTTVTGSTVLTPPTPGCCRLCPLGADCAGGRMYVRPGYWRFGGAQRGTAVVKLCPTPEACPGTSPLDRVPSIWGSNGTSGSNGTRPSSIASGPCLIGHTGRLCGLCLENWRPAARNLCIECGNSAGDKTPKVLLGLFGSLALLAVVTCTVTSSDHDERQVNDAGAENKEDEEEANNGMYVVGKAVGSVAMVETILPFCQRYSAMDSSYPAFKWPPLMTAVTRWLSVTYGSLADVLRVVGPCSLDMTFPERLAMQTCIVPWMIGIAVAAFGLSRCARDRMKQTRNKLLEDIRREAANTSRGRAAKAELRRKVRRAKRPLQYQMSSVVVRLVSILLFSIRFLYPGISSVILRSFLCIDIEGTRVLEEMVDIVCWSPEYYARVGILAVFGCVVLLFGVPVALGFAVHRERRAWREVIKAEDAEKARVLKSLLKTETAMDRVREMGRMKRLEHQHMSAKMMRQVMQRFVRVYKDEYWWWFLLEMIMSLYLIAVLPILPHVGAQVASGGAAALLQVVLPARFQPFAHAEANVVTIVGGCLYYLQYISGLTKLLAESSASSERREQLERADKLIVCVVVLVIVGIVLCLLRTCGALVLFAARAAETQCCSSKDEKESKTKVVPVSQAKPKEKSKPNEEEVAYNAMRPSLMTVRPPSWQVLEACPSRLRKEYLEQWQGLLRLHVEVVAVAMQAVTRGFIERRQSKRQRGGASRLSVEEVHAMSTVEAGAGTLSGPPMRKQESVRQKRKAGDKADIADDDHNEAIVETEPSPTPRNKRQSSTIAAIKMQAMARGAMLARVSKEGAALRHELERERSIRRRRFQSQIMDEAEAKRILQDDAGVHAAHLESLKAEREQLRVGRELRFLEKRWVAVLRKHTKNKDVLKLARPKLVTVLQALFHDIDSAADHTDDVDGMLCQHDLVHVLENMMGRSRANVETASAAEDVMKKNHEIAERMIKTMLSAVQGGDGEHITEAQFIAFFVAIAERRSARQERGQ